MQGQIHWAPSFLRNTLWSAVRSRHWSMHRRELVYSHIRRKQLWFSLLIPLVSDIIWTSIWIITHPPLFQPLSPPSPTLLDTVTMAHRRGFFLLIKLLLLLFALSKGIVLQVAVLWKWPVQQCAWGSGWSDGTKLPFPAQWLNHSFNCSDTVIILTW